MAFSRPSVELRLWRLAFSSLPAFCRGSLAGAIGLSSDLRAPLAAAIKAQRQSAAKIIHDHAVRVFASTSVLQNGRLDAIAVLVTNFRLVRLLVKHFGYRPPLPTLVKIYAQIFLAAFVADEIDDFDVEDVLGQFGFGFAAAIPGAGLLVNSVFDGMVNALFTLRVGFVARKCLLNAGGSLTRSEIRKAANREAREELIPVMKDSLAILPSGLKQIVRSFL